MRSLIKTSIRLLHPSPSFLFSIKTPVFQTSLRFGFAKISKKEEQRSEKKKEKSQAKESLGGDTSEIDLNKYE